jgi:hypothetical protein
MLTDNYKTTGSTNAEFSNFRGDLNNTSCVDIGDSPATTEGKLSLGGAKWRACTQSNRQRKLRPRLNSRMFKDTNTIYPPNQAYNDANNELKSPTKKRP